MPTFRRSRPCGEFPPRVFVSGHMDLTQEEFDEHYRVAIATAAEAGSKFVVGDAPGCDEMAQELLVGLDVGQDYACRPDVTVYHMLERPRRLVDPSIPLVGGFPDDDSRDAAMTAASDEDIAWVRPGKRRNCGTARNIQRRMDQDRERARAERRAMPRFSVNENEAYPVYSLHERPEDAYHGGDVVPMPRELLERYRAASREWSDVQEEIEVWLRRQEVDPV